MVVDAAEGEGFYLAFCFINDYYGVELFYDLLEGLKILSFG